MTYKKPLQNINLVIIGGTGHLALNKLLPSLYNLWCGHTLNSNTRIILTGQNNFTLEEYHLFIKKNINLDYIKTPKWNDFFKNITYIKLCIQDLTDYLPLKKYLPLDQECVYYMATASEHFTCFCENISKINRNTPLSRIVLEKPLGHDLKSFLYIDEIVKKYFTEKQIYRIDHYLGKETVQNILALRFSNRMFEPLWNNNYIDHIQITVSEETSIEKRRAFYEKTGALKDMVQNHILQLLCLTLMEAPLSQNADMIRNEKLKILRALRYFTIKELPMHVLKGRYCETISAETYVALKIFVDNWRWSGVPIYIRTGKNLKERFSEIYVQFKPIPHSIFDDQKAYQLKPNSFVIRLQPDDNIKLNLMSKVKGTGLSLKPIALNLNTATSDHPSDEAYERILIDIIQNIPTLFMRHDELMASWQWIDHIIDHWHSVPTELYKPQSMGPASSFNFIEKDGFKWHE